MDGVMGKVFDVNMDKVVGLTAKLERLHKSAFPSAVRNTLNNAAFQMKQKDILESSKTSFDTIRNPKLFTGKRVLVRKARGWDINNMKSIVGFYDGGDKSAKTAIEGLEKQEFGGTISSGTRYLRDSRVTGSNERNVRYPKRFDKNRLIKPVSRSRMSKQKYVAHMYKAAKTGRTFYFNTSKGTFLAEVKSFQKTNGKVNAEKINLMMSRSKKPTTLPRGRFMTNAARRTAKSLTAFYKDNAEFQFRKHLS